MSISAVSLENYQWLVSDAAAPWLAEADAGVGSVRQVARLRQHLTAQQMGLVLEQAELRRRGLAKFAAARHMFFQGQALEQATDEVIAAYKARRFRLGAAVVDFCCGIGGDLLALACRGPVLGVDRDPVVALLAEANLRRLRQAESRFAASESPETLTFPACHGVVVEAAGPVRLTEAEAWHIDPDRRPHGRRTTRVVLHEPGPELIDALRAVRPGGAVKLAPAAELPAHWPEQAELEWISRRGECRQLVAWFGPLTRIAGQRRATIFGTAPDHGAGAACVRSIVGPIRRVHDPDVPVAAAIGAYLHEPDPAVLASGLQAILAAEHGLAAVDFQSAYWTGDRPLADPALSTFAVADVLPYDARRVKAYLRERHIGRLEVKQRGAGLDPAAVQKQLHVPGDAPATLLLTRLGGQVTAIVGHRVKTDG